MMMLTSKSTLSYIGIAIFLEILFYDNNDTRADNNDKEDDDNDDVDGGRGESDDDDDDDVTMKVSMRMEE